MSPHLPATVGLAAGGSGVKLGDPFAAFNDLRVPTQRRLFKDMLIIPSAARLVIDLNSKPASPRRPVLISLLW